MQNYFSEEEIIDYVCPKCNIKGKITKLLKIVSLPKILIIHVNRLRGSDRYKRLYNPVQFPFEGLDMREFFQPTQLLLEPTEGNMEERVSSYDLVGSIAHYGSSFKGHFVSYCFEEELNSWVELNDLKVKLTGASQMEKSILENVYMLFYRRQDLN